MLGKFKPFTYLYYVINDESYEKQRKVSEWLSTENRILGS